MSIKKLSQDIGRVSREKKERLGDKGAARGPGAVMFTG